MYIRDKWDVDSAAVTGLDVLVLDDIYTSGGSIHSLAHALRTAGAASVRAVVLARNLGADGAWVLPLLRAACEAGRAWKPATNKHDVLTVTRPGFGTPTRTARDSILALKVVAIPHKMQGAKLRGSLSDHVALAHQNLVRKVRQPSPDTPVRPAHDDMPTTLTNIGLLDPNHLNDRWLTHDTASLADPRRRAPDLGTASQDSTRRRDTWNGQHLFPHSDHLLTYR